LKYLKQFEEYGNGSADSAIAKPNDEQKASDTLTPSEHIEMGYQRIREELEYELLSKIKESSPAFFERLLVVELLVAMGYGGSRKDAGKTIGGSGDGGVDGVIKEDRLGLDVIYIQAKRWEAVVGRPEIQKFAGALQGQRAKKGVFITTSAFSKEAMEYVAMIENKIVLIGGKELTGLMVDFDVGVSKIASYDVKRLDLDYFE
jgi:restriction system protein